MGKIFVPFFYFLFWEGLKKHIHVLWLLDASHVKDIRTTKFPIQTEREKKTTVKGFDCHLENDGGGTAEGLVSCAV